MTKKARRTFTSEFKEQMVQLYLNGKPRKDIIREYDLTPSSLDKWVNRTLKNRIVNMCHMILSPNSVTPFAFIIEE
jgi:transposase-like protein